MLVVQLDNAIRSCTESVRKDVFDGFDEEIRRLEESPDFKRSVAKQIIRDHLFASRRAVAESMIIHLEGQVEFLESYMSRTIKDCPLAEIESRIEYLTKIATKKKDVKKSVKIAA